MVLKPHPQEDAEVLKKVKASPIILSQFPDSAPFFKLADFVFCDYGGSAFGALYTDKPVIFLSPDKPEQDDNYSPDSPEVELRESFPTLDKCSTSELRKKLNDDSFWITQKEMREEMRNKYFKVNYGYAGKTAARLLQDYLEESIDP